MNMLEEDPMQPGREVYWWRRVSGSIDFPYRGWIVKMGPTRITIRVADAAAGAEEVIRHVGKDRVQLVGEYCLKVHAQGPSLLDPVNGWGTFTRYIEVDADLQPKRQVDLFGNSCTLRYDRQHWVDAYGMLGDAKINRNRPAGSWGRSEEVSAQEFQAVWAAAEAGSLWPQQLKTSRSATMGNVPIWLTRPGWCPPPLAR
ncbi:hypothetical protein [Piscinibacter gummiphilus]|nr:hypothetical protein [Piscinibacter gummiphilus]